SSGSPRARSSRSSTARSSLCRSRSPGSLPAMRRTLAALALVLLCLPAAAAAALPAPVTLDGFGGAGPGLTPAGTAAGWGIPVRPTGSDAACQSAPVSAGAVRGYAVFEEGRLGAVFLRGGAHTGKGIGIGSTERQVRAAYPRAVVQPHK